MNDIKVVFIDEHGIIHTDGRLGYIYPDDPNEPEPGTNLQEVGAVLDFIKEHFSPDCWTIEDGKVKRFSKDDPRLSLDIYDIKEG